MAQIQLGAVVRRDDNAARRSAAANLLGVLALSSLRSTIRCGRPLLTNAAADFQRAIRFDPGNDDAKYNLELALDTLVASGGGGPQRTQGGRTSISGAGAGSGREGTGY